MPLHRLFHMSSPCAPLNGSAGMTGSSGLRARRPASIPHKTSQAASRANKANREFTTDTRPGDSHYRRQAQRIKTKLGIRLSTLKSRQSRPVAVSALNCSHLACTRRAPDVSQARVHAGGLAEPNALAPQRKWRVHQACTNERGPAGTGGHGQPNWEDVNPLQCKGFTQWGGRGSNPRRPDYESGALTS